MYDNRIFSDGVKGVLKGHWKLVCETPLVVRNGVNICYSVTEADKTRNKDMRIHWRSKDSQDEFEVAGLHYGYEVQGESLVPYYFIPPSSVRGALRSWTIKQMVKPEVQCIMIPPAEEDETDASARPLVNALADAESGYPLIANLFGLALDSGDEASLPGNAGRFSISTEAFSEQKGRPISINGNLLDGDEGPVNACNEMTVRNPIDRITHASNEGGLHHFLEFCRGESFDVHFTIMNPQQSDLGLVSLWVREMEAGFLRIGALSSIGRGRVSVDEQSYELWHMPDGITWPHFSKPEFSAPNTEALAGLWEYSRLLEPEITLSDFEGAVVEAIGGKYVAS